MNKKMQNILKIMLKVLLHANEIVTMQANKNGKKKSEF